MPLKLTCVTAVYNAIESGNRERLIRCVESVAKLKTEHEHLIYDGASTDGTVELLRELETKTPGLKVVSEPDTGIYNALNKGVRDANGEWFYVLGCDDYLIHPEALDALLEADDGGVDMYVTANKVESEGVVRDDFDFKRNIFWSMPYCHQAVVMKSRDAKRFGGFNEHCGIYGDYSLIVQCHLQALRIKYVDAYFVLYHIGGLSARKWGHEPIREIHRSIFHFTETECDYFQRRTALPLRCIIPYMFHKDGTIRRAAVYMIYRWIKGLAR